MSRYREVQSIDGLWLGDIIKTNYGTGPYTVKRILVSDRGYISLTLTLIHPPRHNPGDYYLNHYSLQDGVWTSGRDTFEVIGRAPEPLQPSLFGAAA